jgi:N6-adenosine-specific RNA methylase IME4
MASSTRLISTIVIGDRHRRDLGDIEQLAANIAAIGLLHPIVVTPNGELIAGARRLAAAMRLGWASVPVHVVDIDSIARGELGENACRKDFTPSELVAIAATVERRERELAQQRMTLGKVSTGSTGKTRDKVAAPLGVSGRTLEKAKIIIDAAKAEPEKYGKFREKMDRTGRVNGVYRQLRVAKQAEAIRAEPPPLPGRGPYRVLVADPGWPYDKRDDDPSKEGVRPYPTESIESICKNDIASIVHDDAILFLWVVNFILVNGFHLPVLRAWGDFKPITLITWNKGRAGTGDRARGQTEHVVLAIRGQPIQTCSGQSTWLDAMPKVLDVPRGKHSAKPREFYDLVESLCPAPRYCDLFSRYRHNDKWDCHGDEAPLDDKPYDADDDFAKSIDVAYDAIRAREAAGGPRWNPPGADGLDIPPFLRRKAEGAE